MEMFATICTSSTASALHLLGRKRLFLDGELIPCRQTRPFCLEGAGGSLTFEPPAPALVAATRCLWYSRDRYQVDIIYRDNAGARNLAN